MSPTEIAAYVGAAAWLPQIAAWLYRSLVRPVITIVPDRRAEVGFTPFGPIFNIRMAFASERKDAIVDGFELAIRHEDGEERVFRWMGLVETFSEIRDDAGNRQTVTREESPIALKIGTSSLVEKFVRFQEPRYHQATRPAILALRAHHNFLLRTRPAGASTELLTSKEFFELVDQRQKSFCWKPGRYDVSMRLGSPKRFRLATPAFAFSLSAHDVDQLKQNIALLDVDIKNDVGSGAPNFEPTQINWNWANVEVERLTFQ